MHVDSQWKYTIFGRPRGLAQHLLIQGKYCQNKFEYFFVEMHDKIIHNPKTCSELRCKHTIKHNCQRSTPFSPLLTSLSLALQKYLLWLSLGFTTIVLRPTALPTAVLPVYCQLRHMHYSIVCDVTNRTVFIMSSQWMISLKNIRIECTLNYCSWDLISLLDFIWFVEKRHLHSLLDWQ